MKNKKLTGLIAAFVIILAGGIAVTCLNKNGEGTNEGKTDPGAFNIHRLEYCSKGFGVVLAEYNFDFDDASVEMNLFDYDGTLMRHAESTFTSEQQIKMRDACVNALVLDWDEEYYNPNVEDGDQWYINLFTDEGKKHTYGSNAYPPLYDYVYDTIRSIVDEME